MKARLVNYCDEAVDLVFALDRPRVTIGREVDNMVQLPHDKVSKHHAIISHKNEIWVIEDLQSRNGVFVNGNRIERAELKDRDVIKIGPYQFYFERNPPSHGLGQCYFLDPSTRTTDKTKGDSESTRKP